MARSRSRSRSRSRRQGVTIPIAVVLGLGGVAGVVFDGFKNGSSPGEIAKAAGSTMTGFRDGKFSMTNLKLGALPLLSGIIVHNLANVLGVNRALNQAHVPLLRI